MDNKQYHRVRFPVIVGLLLVSRLAIALANGQEDVVTDEFYRLATEDSGRGFVDKSLLIERFITSDAKILSITRPRGWGKSTNIHMLKRFLEIEVNPEGKARPESELINRKLFVGDGGDCRALEISKWEHVMQMQGQSPVICVSFEEISGYNYRDLLITYKYFLGNLYRKYSYVQTNLNKAEKQEFQSYLSCKASEMKLRMGLKFLSFVLWKWFDGRAKVYILIDDYDAPLSNLFAKLAERIKKEYPTDQPSTDFKALLQCCASSELEDTIGFLRDTLLFTVRNNSALDRALISGAFNVEFSTVNKEPTFAESPYDQHSGLKNGDPFSEFYGFSDAELDRLLANSGLTAISRASLRHWYGYNFTGSIAYKPISIGGFLANGGHFDYYGLPTSTVVQPSLSDDVLLVSDMMQEKLQQLLDDGATNCSIRPAIDYQCVASDPTVLFASGYVNIGPWRGNNDHVKDQSKCNRTATMRRLSIPNREIEKLFQLKVIEWTSAKFKIKPSYFNFTADQLSRQDTKYLSGSLEYLMKRFPLFNNPWDTELCYGGLVRSIAYSFDTVNSSRSYRFVTRKVIEPSVSDFILTLPETYDSVNSSTVIIECKVIENCANLQSELEKHVNEFVEKVQKFNLKEISDSVFAVIVIFCEQNFAIDYKTLSGTSLK